MLQYVAGRSAVSRRRRCFVARYCSELQCVAEVTPPSLEDRRIVCCVLQRVTVCCSVFSVLQYVEVCCSVLQMTRLHSSKIGRESVLCCSMLQCVAVCSSPRVCIVLQCVAVCCSHCTMFRCVAVHNCLVLVRCSVLQCVAVCCNLLPRVAVCRSASQCAAVCPSASQYVAVCCSVLQCVAVCCSAQVFSTCRSVSISSRCSVLQCVAVHRCLALVAMSPFPPASPANIIATPDSRVRAHALAASPLPQTHHAPRTTPHSRLTVAAMCGSVL